MWELNRYVVLLHLAYSCIYNNLLPVFSLTVDQKLIRVLSSGTDMKNHIKSCYSNFLHHSG